MVGAVKMRMGAFCAYFIQNAHDLLSGGQRDGGPRGIGRVEDQAAKGAGQLHQREGIRVFLKEAPDLCLFPTPPAAQGLQGQNSAVPPKLDSRRHMRKRIAGLLPYRVTPEIQPCVRLIELMVRLRETLCDAAGQAQETVAGGGVDGFLAHAGSAGAADNPVLDVIGKLFGLGIQLVG
ncbi:hypothetical protein SDC9_69158 [bioreactor metagenome]|uniref:Uncharacterized protein n=1 Tax=bioreactor metagenome TaxID=1076179 RepID=A0A644Y2D6_9ZZZZ